MPKRRIEDASCAPTKRRITGKQSREGISHSHVAAQASASHPPSLETHWAASSSSESTLATSSRSSASTCVSSADSFAGGQPLAQDACELPESWACMRCTLSNHSATHQCEACGASRDRPADTGTESPRHTPIARNVLANARRRPEKRQKRYVKQPSFALDQRIERALNQRLYLLEMSRHEQSVAATFAVLGSTGNVYSVVFSHQPSCNCPDFMRGNCCCKHILFIWLRVLRCAQDDPMIWQNALLTSELESVLEPFFRRRRRVLPLADKSMRDAYQAAQGRCSGTDTESPSLETESSLPRRCRQALEGEDCPVCFESMTADDESSGLLCFCLACGNNLHRDCIKQWQKASSGECPLCRADWLEPLKHVAPGQPLPAAIAVSRGSSLQKSISGRRGSFGGYLNLR